MRLFILYIWFFFRTLLEKIFGRWHWTAPSWLEGGLQATRHQCARVLTGLLIAAGACAVIFYLPDPPPPKGVTEVVAKVRPVRPTYFGDYPTSIRTYPLVIDFSASVAPIEALQTVVTKGVSISPPVEGTWQWQASNVLTFQPKADWQPGTQLKVSIQPKTLLASHIHLNTRQSVLQTAIQPIRIERKSFAVQEDLEKLGQHYFSATLQFSHPITLPLKDIYPYIQLKTHKSVSFLSGNAQEPFSLFLSQDLRTLYVQSAPFQLPGASTPASLSVADIIGQNSSQPLATLETSVPNRYQLSFDEPSIIYVENQSVYDTILLLDANSALADNGLQKFLRIRRLTTSDAKVLAEGDESLTKQMLARAETISAIQLLSEDGGYHKNAQFKVAVRPEDTLYVEILEGITSVSGYQLDTGLSFVVQAPSYPKTLKFLSEGSLLALNGEKKVGIQSNGVRGVEVEIAQILPNQIHHYVDTSYQRFDNVDTYSDVENRIVRRFYKELSNVDRDPARMQYDVLDMAPYLREMPRSGIFIVTLREQKKQDTKEQVINAPASLSEEEDAEEGDDSQAEYDESEEQYLQEERRLLVVTDLGIIAKDNVADQHDVFIQSIGSGNPVANAKVQVMGRNGLPLQEAYTNAQGHVLFERFSQYTKEQLPLMYFVQSGVDQSFLPIKYNYQHRLDFSRYDIGGLDESYYKPDVVRVFAFTDRGLYRPGDTAQFGMIARNMQMKAIQSLPMRFRILSPDGLTLQDKTVTTDALGWITESFSTDATSPIGRYTMMVSVGDTKKEQVLGTTYFTVRDFEPDRIKVRLDLPVSKLERAWIHPKDLQLTVQADQLFGAPAADRRVESSAQLIPDFAPFAQIQGYSFRPYNPIKNYQTVEFESAQTDEKGQAILPVDIKNFAENTFALQVVAKVYEPNSAAFVAAQQRVMVSPAEYLIGVQPSDPLDYIPMGSPRSLRFMAINNTFAAVKTEPLTVQVWQEKYTSVLTKDPSGKYRYESRKKEVQVSSRELTIEAAKTSMDLNTQDSGQYEVRLINGQNKVVQVVRYYVAGNSNTTHRLDRDATLTIRLNQASYAPGETIDVNITAPYTGAGLITIERDKVYSYQWFHATTTESTQKIVLPAGVEGNAYINVQFVRDLNSDEIYMSPLSYAVAPFAISTKAWENPIQLQAPEEVKPTEPIVLQLTSKRTGKAVVYGVDVGILSVARYKKPDPIGFFFEKRGLGIASSQIMDLILPELSKLMPQTSAAGGDTDDVLESQLNPFKRKRKPPVVWWSGVIDVPEGSSQLTYTPPDYYNGKIRFFVVYVDEQKLGTAQTEVNVRSDIIVTPTMPAAVAPNDTFTVPVSFYNALSVAKTITVSASATQGLTIGENAVQTVSIPPRSEQQLYWPVRANNQLGEAVLTWSVAATGTKPIQTTESTSVRPLSAYQVKVAAVHLGQQPQSLALDRVLHAEERNVHLTIGGPLVLAQAIAARHTQSAETKVQMTNALLNRALFQFVAQASHGKTADSVLTYQQVEAQLLNLQDQETGAIQAYTDAREGTNNTTNLNVLAFYIEAQRQGYSVNPNSLDVLNRYVRKRVLNKLGSNNIADAARALYLFTKQDMVLTSETQAVRAYLDTYSNGWQKTSTALYLAAVYERYQLKDKSKELLQQWVKAQTADSLLKLPELEQLQVLTVLAEVFPQEFFKVSPKLWQMMADRVYQNHISYMNISDWILALLAMDRANPSTENLKLWLEKGAQATTIEKPFIWNQPVPLDRDIRSVKIVPQKNAAAGIYFAVLVQAGFDQTLPEQAIKNGIEIIHSYVDSTGNPLETIRVGDEFYAKIQLRVIDPTLYHHQIRVLDLLPGGVQILDIAKAPVGSSEADEASSAEDASSGREVSVEGIWMTLVKYDDRAFLTGRLGSKKAVVTAYYRLQASQAGTFAIPPAFVESIDRPSFFGRSAQQGQITILPK